MDELTVRLASSASSKKYNVFKLHKDDDVTWTDAKMERENDYQPWQIKLGQGRSKRRFKAIKEGGVADNASYFVFYKSNDKNDTYEVCPIDEWYNVSATQRYKTLTAEEAEQKFEQRDKMLNLFSVMHLKKNGESKEEGGSSGHDRKAFKVSELDDWDDSGDDAGSGSDEGDMDSKKKAKKKSIKKEKDDPDEAPDEAKEDSDEGDHEQREVDYMSDSSSESDSDAPEEKDEADVKGIAEEEAMRDLLSTDDEDDAVNAQQKGSKTSDNKNSLGTVEIPDGNGSEESSDSDDYDVDEEKMDSLFMKKSLPARLSIIKPEIKQEPEPAASSVNRQAPANNKRKAAPEVSAPIPQPAVKRPCPAEAPSSPPNGQEKIVEDLIRKYLSRKPMTLKTLLKDIKSKLKRMEGATPEMDNDLVNTIASIIKRLQPDKQKINEVTYLSLKS